MKKNKMMRAASALLVAVLLTTSVISGTFAKYITEDEGSDEARVAKWGVVIEADSFGMFKTDYAKDDTKATFTGDYSVSSEEAADRDNVLAPGTSGSFANIAITGTPEVAVDVAIVADVQVSNNWIVDGDFYCPIVVTVGTESISGLDYDDAEEFAGAIKAKIDGKSAQYAPNEDLGETYGNDSTNLDLAWSWAFEGTQGTKNVQTDVKDTVLGDKAVAGDLVISIGLEITVTQID